MCVTRDHTISPNAVQSSPESRNPARTTDTTRPIDTTTASKIKARRGQTATAEAAPSQQRRMQHTTCVYGRKTTTTRLQHTLDYDKLSVYSCVIWMHVRLVDERSLAATTTRPTTTPHKKVRHISGTPFGMGIVVFVVVVIF